MVTYPGDNLPYPEPEPDPPLDAYRRQYEESEEAFLDEESEEELEEITTEETAPTEPLSEGPKVDEDVPDPASEITAEIAALEAAGDWLKAGQKKLERMQLERNPSALQGESDSETVKSLMAEISDAETNADWYKSGLAKYRLMSVRAAADPSGIATTSEEAAPSPDAQELEAKILRAEEAGNWAESLRLKAQKIPGVSL